MRRLDPAGERGAVAVTVAVMLVVLLGSAAIAVDVGALYLEKRELQNGADAGALAIGQDCAASVASAGCADIATALTTARTYANANARDAAATVADSGGVAFDHTANKVTVTVDTDDPSSSDRSRLAHWFAPLLGADATAVTAKGVAIWGPVALTGGEAHIPVTVGMCELLHATNGGTSFYLPPGEAGPLELGAAYPFPPRWDRLDTATGQVVAAAQPPAKLQFQSGNPVQPSYCDPGQAGQNFPGGFGGLATTSSCTLESFEGNAASSQGSLIENNDCKNYCTGANAVCNSDPLMILGKVVYLPIFDAHNAATKSYHLSQPAAFYVTSYDFGGGKYRGTLPNWQSCKAGGTQPECIEGYFTTAAPAISGEVDLDGHDTGMRTTQLVLE